MTLPGFIPVDDMPRQSDYPLVVHYGKGEEEILHHCSDKGTWQNAWNDAKRWLTQQKKGKIFTSDILMTKGENCEQTWCGYCVKIGTRGNVYEVISMDESRHKENEEYGALHAQSMSI